MKKEKNYLPSSIKEIKTQYGSMLVANFKVEELKAIENKGHTWASVHWGAYLVLYWKKDNT